MTLSPRQQQLLRLYSVGCSDTEIAVRFGISVWTVKEYGAGLRQKLQARNRAHCVAVGLQHGLISPDPAVIEGRA